MAIQFTCPYCHKEFPYNRGKVDAEISNIRQRIAEIDRRMGELKPCYQTENIKKERRNLGIEKLRITEKLVELKALRKQADEHRRLMELEMFKTVVRDKYGEKEFENLIKERDELMEAYNISDTMKHEYTRSNHLSTVTSINKI